MHLMMGGVQARAKWLLHSPVARLLQQLLLVCGKPGGHQLLHPGHLIHQAADGSCLDVLCSAATARS
jgi:hypothetical protein